MGIADKGEVEVVLKLSPEMRAPLYNQDTFLFRPEVPLYYYDHLILYLVHLVISLT